MNDLGTCKGHDTGALGINNLGQIVGYVFNGIGTPNHGFVRSDTGSLLDLNDLISSSSRWTLENATGINDNGWIVGFGINPSGRVDGYLLTPTPEPSVLALLTIAAAIGSVGYTCRRRCKKGSEQFFVRRDLSGTFRRPLR